MKRILLPTDFSDNAKVALDYAIDLANQFGTKLTLLHCFKVMTSTGSFISMERYLREDAENDMATLVEGVKNRLNDGIELETKILKGDAILLTADLSDRLNYDLIIMGTHGASGIKSVFMGSTARGLLERALTPMLVIPNTSKYKTLKKIVFATDNLDFPSMLEEVTPLFEITKKLGAKILIFHVKEAGTDVNVALDSEEALQEIDHKYHIIERTDKGINESIDTFAEKYGADMICMIKQDRGFWGKLLHNSLTQKELRHSSLPFLILKEVDHSTS